MIGYPITYGDTSNGFTSETILTEISKYQANEENIANFTRGYKFGLLVFCISGALLRSTAAFASDKGMLPTIVDSCPETGQPPSETPGPGPGPAKPGSLANVPTSDQGAFGASTLGICGVTTKSGAYWIGFICAATVMIGVSMASIPADGHAPL